METVIGLLVVTGMRSGEVVRLDRGDVDLGSGPTCGSSPPSSTSQGNWHCMRATMEALKSYERQRDRHWPRPATAGFFVSSNGRRLTQSSLEQNFAELVLRVGLEPAAGSRARRPRPHDLQT